MQADLAQARRGLVLESDLHLTLLATPVRPQLQVNWPRLYERVQRLAPAEKRVAELVGLDKGYLQVGGLERGWPGDPVLWE